MRAAVEHAVTSMRSRYDEPITLHELAAEVFVSPFHFSRVFASTVGLSPGRYLTAVRLFEAKRRLVATDDTIADIVCAVGYSSVGTFTSRFTRAVGMTPGQYRDPAIRDGLLAMSPDFSHVPSADVLAQATTEGHGGANMAVAVRSGEVGLDRVGVGLFDGAAPQAGPVAFAPVAQGGSGVVLRGLPVGHWTVMATGVADAAAGYVPLTASAPVEVRPSEAAVPPVELELSEPTTTDVPVAVSLLDPALAQSGVGAAVTGTRHLRAVA